MFNPKYFVHHKSWPQPVSYKLPLDACVNDASYKNTLQKAPLSLARQYIQDNFCCQEGSVSSHYARIVTVFLQQEGITNMEQPVKSSDCNIIDNV